MQAQQEGATFLLPVVASTRLLLLACCGPYCWASPSHQPSAMGTTALHTTFQHALADISLQLSMATCDAEEAMAQFSISHGYNSPSYHLSTCPSPHISTAKHGSM
jgi:hypothetical protein